MTLLSYYSNHRKRDSCNTTILWILPSSSPQKNLGKDGSMPFLGTLVTPQEDGTLTTWVYRKPTHTDSYLHWDSHHNLACRYSVINTLTHKAKQCAPTLNCSRKN